MFTTFCSDPTPVDAILQQVADGEMQKFQSAEITAPNGKERRTVAIKQGSFSGFIRQGTHIPMGLIIS